MRSRHLNFLRAAVASGLVMALSGCMTVTLKADGFGDDDVYFTALNGKNVEHIEESDWAGFLFWGLVPIHQPNPAQVLKPRLGKGQRLANFRITTPC